MSEAKVVAKGHSTYFWATDSIKDIYIVEEKASLNC